MGSAGDPLDAAVERMLRGDDEAFRIVYRVVGPKLERYLSALVGVNEAEDVASEAWAQACRDMASFQGDADGFRGWITTIARHRALDHLRARGRRPQSAGPIEEFAEERAPDDVESAVAELLSTHDAIQLIAALPREQAEAVLLRAVMGLDAKSAGRILDRSPGAVRTAAYRGLKALAEHAAVLPSDKSRQSSAEGMR